METLIILSLNPSVYYAKHFINISKSRVIDNPFNSDTIHPVVKRLVDIKEEDELQNGFQWVETRSEIYGDEKGYISLPIKKKVKLISLNIYQEQKEREKLSTDTIKEIESFTKHLESCVRSARKEYIKYLSKLGYIEEETKDYDEDIRYFMVHPLFINEWRKDNSKKYPDWAVKEIGYFPEN